MTSAIRKHPRLTFCLVAASLLGLWYFSGCGRSPIPFDEAKWKKHSSRLRMSGDLISLISREKWQRNVVVSRLGTPEEEHRYVYGLNNGMTETFYSDSTNKSWGACDLAYFMGQTVTSNCASENTWHFLIFKFDGDGNIVEMEVRTPGF